MAKNNAIDLDVTVNADGYTIGGGDTPRDFTVTGGDIVATGGATIANGDLLIGNAADNSVELGQITGGDNIAVTTSAGGLELDVDGKTGVDANLVSGTAGTNGNLSQWNADGDLIDSSLGTSTVSGHIANTSNPHSVTKAQVGLSNVTNNAQYYAGGTDVAIADGGTGAGDAATAFSNLKQAATTSATGVVELATTAETTTGTDATRAVTPAGLLGTLDSISNIIKLKAPEGFLINGQIVTSISNDDLVLAVKTLAGTDPSTTDPVFVRLGNTIYTLTAALSVTKADGTNWANLGSSEIGNQEVDLFAYIGYRASDTSLFIGWSRIPCGINYGNFSATTTNELYLAYSGSAPASTDPVAVIGRFNAQLEPSGSGHDWTIPSPSLIINRPIYTTRWLTFAPTLVGWSSAPTNTGYRYKVTDSYCDVSWRQGTGATSNSTSTTGTMPFSVAPFTNYIDIGFVTGDDNGSSIAGRGVVQTSSNTIIFNSTLAGAAWTASGSKRIATYRVSVPVVII